MASFFTGENQKFPNANISNFGNTNNNNNNNNNNPTYSNSTTNNFLIKNQQRPIHPLTTRFINQEFITNCPNRYKQKLNRVNGLLSHHFINENINNINCKFYNLFKISIELEIQLQIKGYQLSVFVGDDIGVKIAVIQNVLFEGFKIITNNVVTNFLELFKKRLNAFIPMNNNIFVQQLQLLYDRPQPIESEQPTQSHQPPPALPPPHNTTIEKKSESVHQDPDDEFIDDKNDKIKEVKLLGSEMGNYNINNNNINNNNLCGNGYDYDESDEEDIEQINEMKDIVVPVEEKDIFKPDFTENKYDKPLANGDSCGTLKRASFKDFMLKKELMRAIRDANFEYPSEVQNNAIPKAILGHDMIVEARSGMGKTTIFVLATLAQVQPDTDIIDTLILCHTREMAYQIFGKFERFSKYMIDVQIGCVYGGIPYLESKRVIEQEKPHILIGTPGRIVHLLETSVLQLNRLKRFIIDECDNMLHQIDMRKQVQDIFKRTPHSKQVMMFGATIDDSSKLLYRKFTKDAQEIYVVDKPLTLRGLQQHFVKLTEREKNRKLNDLLDALDFNQVVIFVRTKDRAIELNKLLGQRAFPSICVHNNMRQIERLKLFEAFKQYKHRILVITNVFDRSVDIERVNVVINYDMPQDTDEYLHRVGRVRFDKKCIAITFLANYDEFSKMSEIQQKVQTSITPLPNSIPTLSYANYF